jgi:hypothetical protein
MVVLVFVCSQCHLFKRRIRVAWSRILGCGIPQSRQIRSQLLSSFQPRLDPLGTSVEKRRGTMAQRKNSYAYYN